jgi:HAD superfamily hydrolase (TIGR01549 family)
VTPLRLRAVLFDWDGTLVNSAEKTYRCYVQVFEGFGIRFDQARFQETYSPDWHQTYRAVGLPLESWPLADTRWIDCYQGSASALVPGVPEALARIRERSLVQGVVSSGDGGRVRSELEVLGLAGLFAVLVCGGDTVRRKPDPQPLNAALERLGLGPHEAVYVGDSPEDVQMARAAGVFSVGIPGGFPNRQALVASAPDLLAPSLAAALERLLA